MSPSIVWENELYRIVRQVELPSPGTHAEIKYSLELAEKDAMGDRRWVISYGWEVGKLDQGHEGSWRLLKPLNALLERLFEERRARELLVADGEPETLT